MSRAQETSPRDYLYFGAFFLVELFASLEVTAALVAAPHIGEALQLRPAHQSWIINAYLYPLFAAAVALLFFSRRLRAAVSPGWFFVVGLGGFAVGGLACFLAPDRELFFAGRVIQGMGAAVAFTGELWTATEYYRARIAQPLFWGECGGAIGVVAGPLVGGMFTGMSEQGWRGVFILDAGLSLLALLMSQAVFRAVKRDLAPKPAAGKPFTSFFYLMILSQTAVSCLTVGSEYLFSDFLQSKLDKSPMFVGWMTFIASAGIVAGSLMMARRNREFARRTRGSIFGIMAGMCLLTAALKFGAITAAALPIFAIGYFMGTANVAIYAAIVERTAKENFMTASLVYLLAMQAGNAIGVQFVGIGQSYDLDIVWTTAAQLAPVFILAAALRRICISEPAVPAEQEGAL